MSEVSVVVIDWTEIGWSLPTPTLPTWIWRVGRRGASTGGGAAGMPRSIAVMRPRLAGGFESSAARPRTTGYDSRLRGTTRSPTISTMPSTRITEAMT